MKTRLLISVGTDHHRFGRLVDWVDEWVVANFGADPADPRRADLQYVLQHGHTRPSPHAQNMTIIARDDLLTLMAESDLVVVQGGPGSIIDARSCGKVPLAVPRISALDEVVDDHQVAFARLMASRGECILAEDKATLHGLLSTYAATPALLVKEPDPSPAAETAAAVMAEMGRVAGRPSHRVDWRRAVQIVRLALPKR